MKLPFGRRPATKVQPQAPTHAPDAGARWVAVCEASRLKDDRPFTATVGDTPILVVRHDGVVHALQNRCSHAEAGFDGTPLKAGRLVCPMHGAEFALTDGAVCRGPATRPVATLPCRVAASGVVEVAMAPAES